MQPFDSCIAEPATAGFIKCVVWDLDDTLWQGTLIDGDSLVVSPGVEHVIRTLDERGILQSIASKNNHQEAWAQVGAFGLQDYFLCPRICWKSKSESIRAIAETLGLGLDTFAFIDDQAFERAEVGHFLPMVRIVSAGEIETLLERPDMQPQFGTAESSSRRKMYQAEAARIQSEQAFRGTKEQFLLTLAMHMTVRPAKEADLLRAQELTLRTNQLNTTGRHYSLEQLRALSASPDHRLFVAELEDVFGVYGIVGLALLECAGDAWKILLLIMSCRVVARGISTALLNCVLEAAKRRGMKLFAEFVETGRNRMMYITYKFQGFREVSVDGNNILLCHDLEEIGPGAAHMSIDCVEM